MMASLPTIRIRGEGGIGTGFASSRCRTRERLCFVLPPSAGFGGIALQSGKTIDRFFLRFFMIIKVIHSRPFVLTAALKSYIISAMEKSSFHSDDSTLRQPCPYWGLMAHCDAFVLPVSRKFLHDCEQGILYSRKLDMLSWWGWSPRERCD